MNNVSLPILLLIPLIGSLVLFSLKQEQARLAKWIALVVSLIVVVYTAVLGALFDTGAGADRFQFRGSWVWIKDLGVHLSFGLDGIALVLIAMTVVLIPTVILASWNAFDSKAGAEEEIEVGAKRRSVKNFMGLILLIEFFMIAIFAATDVFLFYVVFEAMLVPMYFVIGSFGGPRRQYAAMKFFLYSLAGGMVLLASVIGLYITTGSRTFAFSELIGAVPDNTTQKWLFLGFFFAFAIKAPLVPFHTWLPDAAGQAPIGVTVLIVGVLDKVGTFGLLRYCLPMFPDASQVLAPLVLTLGVVGVVYGAILAAGQTDMKRFIAYVSIAHFGFMAVGIFAFSTQSVIGAATYMLNHSLATGLLILVIGLIVMRGGSSRIADYGGMQKVTPLLGGMLMVAVMTTLSLPGTNSFVSEFLVLIGSFDPRPVFSIIATIGIILAAVYVLWFYQRVMTGPVRGDAMLDAVPGPGTVADPEISAKRTIKDLSKKEVAVLTPLVVLIIGLGLYPKPMLDAVTPSVEATISAVQEGN